jgi:hypothetical protein
MVEVRCHVHAGHPEKSHALALRSSSERSCLANIFIGTSLRQASVRRTSRYRSSGIRAEHADDGRDDIDSVERERDHNPAHQ